MESEYYDYSTEMLTRNQTLYDAYLMAAPLVRMHGRDVSVRVTFSGGESRNETIGSALDKLTNKIIAKRLTWTTRGVIN